MRHNRINAAKVIAELMGSPDFRSELRDRATDNIVVVLPGDTIGYLFERLKAHPGEAVVAVPAGESRIDVLSFLPESRLDDECDPLDLHKDSTVSMLITLLAHYPRSYSCRVVDGGRFELIDPPGPKTVPAGM